MKNKFIYFMIVVVIIELFIIAEYFGQKDIIYGIIGLITISTIIQIYYIKYLKPNHKPSLLERLDTIITGGIWKQILAFMVVIVTILAICSTLALFTEETILGKARGADKIWSVVYHFLDPGNIHQESVTSMKVFTLLMYISRI